uniref:Lsm14b-a protein n=1 Tax=Fopius arisanus TaxID=64838 RepID=A0A0C9RVF6_9HYME
MSLYQFVAEMCLSCFFFNFFFVDVCFLFVVLTYLVRNQSIPCCLIPIRRSQRTDWRIERKLNSETFGVSSTRRGGFFRGRGYYLNRGMPGGMYRGNSGGQMGGYRGNYRGQRGGNNANRKPGQNQNNANQNRNSNEQTSQPQQTSRLISGTV